MSEALGEKELVQTSDQVKEIKELRLESVGCLF